MRKLTRTKQFLLMLTLLLTAAVQGAWADDTYTVTFKANGKTKTVENVTLPKTFMCSYDNENGELDYIIRELYNLPVETYCNKNSSPTASGSDKVTAGKNDKDHYITISGPFDGTATVTGSYLNQLSDWFDYTLEITCPDPNAIALTEVTAGNKWSFTMPASNVELNVEYYKDGVIQFAEGEGSDATVITALSKGSNAEPFALPISHTGDGTVSYESSNTDVATVDADGKVTLKGITGETTITATVTPAANGDYYYETTTATLALTVTLPQHDITLKTENAELADVKKDITVKAGDTELTIGDDGTVTGVPEQQTVNVKYNGRKKVLGVTATKKAATTPLDITTTAWSAGTFAVPEGGLTYSDAITVSGDVTLVLTDGETLILNKGISLADGTTLTIQGNGTMNVNGTNGNVDSSIGGSGTIILTSGTLNAKGGNGGSIGNNKSGVFADNGGVAINGSVTVNGGTLTATGGNAGNIGNNCNECKSGNGAPAINGSLTINGGSVTTATGNNGTQGTGGDDNSLGDPAGAVAGTVTDNRSN